MLVALGAARPGRVAGRDGVHLSRRREGQRQEHGNEEKGVFPHGQQV